MSRLGSDERNIARLVPVVALNRVPSELTGWSKVVTVDSLSTITLTCIAGGGQVVPHGIDADTMFALTALYVIAGQPQDGFITTNGAELCSIIGIPRSKNIYDRLQESLYRLLTVSIHVFEAWATTQKNGTKAWQNKSFGIINSLHEIGLDESSNAKPGTFRSTTMLKIGLSPELIDSIRDGHIRSVDLDFYSKLEQPLSRLLYRTLEEQKYQNNNPSEFNIPLSEWGNHLGLRNIVRDENKSVVTVKVQKKYEVPKTSPFRPDKIRRTLEPAHEELRQKGYLAKVEYVGRGQNQNVYYGFNINPIQNPVDSIVVGLLTHRGMTLKTAELHVRTHGENAVNRAVAVFDARQQSGYTIKNAGGLMSDILTNPDKYLLKEMPAPKHQTGKKVDKATPIIDTNVSPSPASVEDQRRTNTFFIEGWAKRNLVTGSQLPGLLALVRRGRLDDVSLSKLAFQNVVDVQKFVFEILAQG